MVILKEVMHSDEGILNTDDDDYRFNEHLW